jgi:triacylglycerol lipase
MTTAALSPSPGTRGRFSGRGMPPLRYTGRWKSQPPVWLEGRGALEYLRLVRHPIFRGVGVADGAGSPVLLVPGFMAGDGSLGVLRNWLRRAGHDVEVTGLVFNIRYSELVARAITVRLREMHQRLGRKVTIVGHSRGGILAKVVADRQPGAVRRVVTLGSPLGDPYDIHPLTMAGVRFAHALNVLRYACGGGVELPFLRELEAPARVPLVSIYSRTDGIVHWEACLRPDAVCLEVAGSHLGLSVNLHVYKLLAGLLPSRSALRGPESHGPRRRDAAGGAAPGRLSGNPIGQPLARPPPRARVFRPRSHGRP